MEDGWDEAEPRVEGWLKAALVLLGLGVALTFVFAAVVRDVAHRGEAVQTEMDDQRIRQYGVAGDDGR